MQYPIYFSIAIFAVTPPSMAGTIGAIFNCALQLGAAVGIAMVTSIETSVERDSPGGYQGYDGRRAAYWYIFSVAAVLLIATAVFYHTEARAPETEVDAVAEAWMKHKTSGDALDEKMQEAEQGKLPTYLIADEEDLGEIKLESEASGWREI